MAPFPGIGGKDDLRAVGKTLVTWYQTHSRDLPWRHTQDPYIIWVSEIMLQQTRVETVLAYFGPFLSRFPTLSSLALASVNDVLKAWEGMGYYARARNLHEAARQVQRQHGGLLPPSVSDLRKLPGIGHYTAAAISSMAFGQDAIALDGNLRRVLCRLYGIDDDPGRPQTQRRLEQLAYLMMPPGSSGQFNQSLMDLGATVCIPKRPRCQLCPLADCCTSLREGIQNELPIRATRRHRPHRDVTAGVIQNGNGHFLITQRPMEGLLGGLWEFPGGKRRPGEGLEVCLQRELDEELALHVRVGDLVCTVEHGFTHFQMTLYAYFCSILDGEPQCLGCRDLRWVMLDQLDEYAFGVADQQIISSLRGR